MKMQMDMRDALRTLAAVIQPTEPAAADLMVQAAGALDDLALECDRLKEALKEA